MTFLNFLTINLFFDIACGVFFVALCYKIKSIEKCLKETQEELDVVMKNPQLARKMWNKKHLNK